MVTGINESNSRQTTNITGQGCQQDRARFHYPTGSAPLARH